jgi:hypothetical protein
VNWFQSWLVRIVLIVVFLVLLMVRACSAPVVADCRLVQEASPGGAEDEAPVDDRGDTGSHLEGVVFVANGQADDATAALGGGAAVDLSSSDGVTDFLNEWHCPGGERGLDRSDLAPVVDSEIWQSMSNRLDLVELPDGLGLEDAIATLTTEGIEADPVQVLGTANHYGALPGVSPSELVELQGVGQKIQTDRERGSERVIAVIDTGFYGHTEIVMGAGLKVQNYDGLNSELVTPGRPFYDRLPWRFGRAPVADLDRYQGGPGLCSISHGEFVASVVRQVDSSATIVGVNAFPVRHDKNDPRANCWETSEIMVMFALGRLEASGLAFDALNMSLGSHSHLVLSEAELGSEEPTIDIDPDLSVSLISMDGAFGDGELPRWIGSAYASGGNTISYRGVPVYPAAYDAFVGTSAISRDGLWFVWDEDESPLPAPPGGPGVVPQRGQIDYPWIQMFAPGCDLVGLGAPSADDAVLWSGSSFASPMAAAVGTGRSIGYDMIPDSMDHETYGIDEDLASSCPAPREGALDG